MWAQTATQIGRIIRTARLHRKLSQAELARMLGTTQAWISEVEKGKETAQIGLVLRALNRLGVKLRTDIVPWATPGNATRQGTDGVDLNHIITSLSQNSPRGGTKK
jgi:y4mF family transcriptional regulator